MKCIVEAINGPSVYQFQGTTAELRIYATKDFLTFDGQVIPQGVPPLQRSWYISVDCEVQGGNILYVPSFEIDSTTDGDPANAKYIAQLYDQSGAYIGPFPWVQSSGFAVPAIGSHTWLTLRAYSRGRTSATAPITFPSTDTVTAMIAAAVSQQLRKSSETLVGNTALSIDPIDPTFPIALGENDGRLSGLLFNVKSPAYGAVGDGVAIDYAAFQSAISAAGLLGGGVVYAPAGNYYMGTAAQGTLLRVDSDNVSIRGDGMGKTVLTYSSAGRTGAAGSGALLYVGNTAVNHAADYFSISDLTISDANTSGSYGGAGPSGIWVYLCDNVRIERIECLNVKGNAGITVQGTTPPNKNVWIRDCVITGTSAGGWVDGDGIGVGELTNVYVENNVITGVTRNGIEGGGSGTDIFIHKNAINMQNHGQAGIATISGSRIIVSHNSVIDWSNAGGSHGIGLANDLTTIPIKDVIISDNILKSAYGGVPAAAINFQPMAGTAVSLLGPINIHNNTIKNFTPISIWTATKMKIHDNDIDTDTASVAAINGTTGGNPAIDAGDTIEIYNNHVHGFTFAPAELVAIDPNWKSANLIIRDNKLGRTVADASTGAIDGITATEATAGSIAANAASAEFTTTILGALVGDEVKIVPNVNWSTGLVPTGKVTAGDTVKWRVFNTTGGALSIGGYPDTLVTMLVIRH